MISNVTIIGQGAIGSLWAFYLAQAGMRVTLVGRAAQAQRINLQVTLANGKQEQVEVDYLANQLPSHQDLVIVTTKAYQVESALTPWLNQLVSTPIVLLHNGMGSVDSLPLQPSHQILLATTSHAALKTASHTLAHTGLGHTFIGCYQGINEQTGQAIAQLLNQALPPVEYSHKILRALWRKLAINCVINPLTAIDNCNNGQLSAPQYQPVIDKVCREISLITQQLSLELSYVELRQLVNQVISNTAANYSSMQQDIVNQRPTENDFISGYVINQAKKLAISVPENQRLYQAIWALEQSAL